MIDDEPTPEPKDGAGFTNYGLIARQETGESPLVAGIDYRPNEDDRQKHIKEAQQRVEGAHSQTESRTDKKIEGEFAPEKSLLDEAYESLKNHESQPPNPDEIIAIRGLPRGGLGLLEDQPEYGVLQDHDVSKETLASGHITRGQLRQAGYIFLNRLGGGEKPIISGTIPDPDDAETTLDFTKRILLTRKEVDKIYRHQLAHPAIYGIQGQDLDEVRKDMLIFLYDATFELPYRDEGSFLQVALPLELDETVILSKEAQSSDAKAEEAISDWENVKNYWKWQERHYEDLNPDTPLNDLEIMQELQKAFSRHFCTDIYTWPGDTDPVGTKDIRGHEINSAISKRQERLSGQASPFLESGFVFDDNPDVEVIVELSPGKFGNRRLNMGNLHLFGAHPDFPGFSEIGGDGDQVYMTIGTYVESLYEKDADRRKVLQNQEQDKLQADPISRVIPKYQARLLEQELQELHGADIEAVKAHQEAEREKELGKDSWL